MTKTISNMTTGCGNTTSRVPTGTVSSTYVLGVLEFAREYGAELAPLLDVLQVSHADLHDATRRLPLARLQALFDACAEVLHDPAFALRFGTGVPCANLTLASPLAAAVPTESSRAAAGRTLRDALEGLNRYAPLGVHFGADAPAVRYRFVADDEGVWLEDLRPTDDAAWYWPHLTESSFARFVTGMRQRGGNAVVRAVQVTHAAPACDAHRTVYADVFRVPVQFRAHRNAICLDPTFLDRPLEPLPPPVQAVLTAHADAQLQTVLRDGAWRRRVEELLQARLRAPASQRFTLRHLCRELAVSRQTLSRRLRTEGTTFAEVQELVQRRVADALLRDDALPVAVVSDRLGYSEPAAFSRAYKRWTGRPPSTVARDR